MDWREIRQYLLLATGYQLKMKGPFGQPKMIELEMDQGSRHMLKFLTLGNGTMKRVVRIENEDWVLALVGDSPTAEKDMQNEVRTLLELSAAGVRVPEPFVTGPQGEILFNLTVTNPDSDEIDKVYPAFLQQFLPYREMDKLKKREDFAKDFIIDNGVPPTIAQTIADLKAVLARLKVREWGDFQVMYQKATGYVYVFDPLPDNNSDVSSAKIVEKWLSDIEAAIAAKHRNTSSTEKEVKTARGSWEV